MIADLIILCVWIGFAMAFLIGMGFLMTWVERKLSAIMADRIGANRCYVALPFGIKIILWGIVQCAADGIKMLSKEPFAPKTTERLVFYMAPWIVFTPVLLAFALIPFGGRIRPSEVFSFIPPVADFFRSRSYMMQIAPLDSGAVALLAIAGIGIIGAVLSGWASNNKYSLIGGIRAASQMISYEITIGLTVLAVVVGYNSLDLNGIVVQQSHLMGGCVPAWGIILQPFTAVLFLISAMAENKRAPFDLPEAESELVAGYFTEYSGMRMGFFMFAEFIEIVIHAAVFVTFFLGGYQLPFMVGEHLMLPGHDIVIPQAVLVVLWPAVFVAKVFVISCAQVLIRWTLPRFRYDQLLRFGWQYLIPAGMLNLIAVVLVKWWMQP